MHGEALYRLCIKRKIYKCDKNFAINVGIGYNSATPRLAIPLICI